MGRLFDALPESFLKKVLTDEKPDTVDNLLNIKAQFEKETDKERKVIFKERLSTAFWTLYAEIGRKMSKNLSREKRLLLRFGLFDLKYLSSDDQKFILAVKFDDPDPENTMFYADEWLLAVAEGRIKPSIVDEASRSVTEKKDAGAQSKIERIQGSMDGDKRNYGSFNEKRKMLEDAVVSLVNMIVSHSHDSLIGMPDNYNEDQLRKMDEMQDAVRELKKIDKDMRLAKNSYYDRYEELRALQAEMGSAPQQNLTEPQNYGAADARTLENEVNNALRQMAKMCVGRQGNHFPMLLSSFMPKETRDYNFKGNALKFMQDIEKLDPTIFERIYKQNTTRIPPYIILIPGYGNLGICWEPYDKYNKATSKGRIAIPIFSRNPRLSIVMAMGDFRWQVAKEMAGYHWMDPSEGITGKYYEYLSENKLKGDIKTQFIEDYLLWITKESEGVQKLHKDVRYIFWRNIPFPKELKENLKNKGFYYNELYEKEKIYDMSH